MEETAQRRDIVFSICSAVDQQSTIPIAQQLRPDDSRSLWTVASLLRGQEKTAALSASAARNDRKPPIVDPARYSEVMPLSWLDPSYRSHIRLRIHAFRIMRALEISLEHFFHSDDSMQMRRGDPSFLLCGQRTSSAHGVLDPKQMLHQHKGPCNIIRKQPTCRPLRGFLIKHPNTFSPISAAPHGVCAFPRKIFQTFRLASR